MPSGVRQRALGGQSAETPRTQKVTREWQTDVFSSLRAPVVDARTCANTSGLLILSARRCRFAFDHAGVMDRNTQGPDAPSRASLAGSSRSVGYHPTPKPSALIELRTRIHRGRTRVQQRSPCGECTRGGAEREEEELTLHRGGVGSLKPDL